MRTPGIELLWWEGCPSTDKARDELEAALRDVGLDRAEVWMREIRTDEDALETEFAGSPTILIDGIDMLTGASGTATSSEQEQVVPVGLGCRVYRRRDGRTSPTPDPDDLRDALRRASARSEEVTR